jgi:hypothetical protein
MTSTGTETYSAKPPYPCTVGDLRAGDVRRRDVMGGLIHEYSIAA